jgi:CMP-N,N'-diacetyllegionaminic acid synthase
MLSSKIIALIPARSGSKRIVDKNIKKLGHHPLLAYTIQAALQSKIFDSVVCATDSKLYADIAMYYGAEVPFLRSNLISDDNSPDIDWVKSMLLGLKASGREFEFFSILRPTSPFRLPQTILRAWSIFKNSNNADSLRAIEKCTQHPGKMWVRRGEVILPLMPFTLNEIPWHSNQYSALPEVYVQNASLEIAKTNLVLDNNSIAGEIVLPFITEGLEGFDINYTEDFQLAEKYILTEKEILPSVDIFPFN